jgi:hypothetical protein
MIEIETRLDPARFLRIHRSLIVNIDRIRYLQGCGYGEYLVVLKNGKNLPLSRVIVTDSTVFWRRPQFCRTIPRMLGVKLRPTIRALPPSFTTIRPRGAEKVAPLRQYGRRFISLCIMEHELNFPKIRGEMYDPSAR